MKLLRSHLLEAPAPLVLMVDSRDLQLGNVKVVPEMFRAELKTERAGSDTNIKGHASLKLIEICDRCLTPYPSQVEPSFQILVTEKESLSSGEEATDIYHFPSDEPEFDLGPVVRDSILLERSMKRVCKEDCKGLCPHCGTNLNLSDCDCGSDEIDERWEPLRELSLSRREQ